MNKEYLIENENLIDAIKRGLTELLNIGNGLLLFGIDIFTKPWYRNIMEIYVPQAFELYKISLEKPTEDIRKYNDIWMRSSFKSFLSEIEKFIKFTTSILLNSKPETFFSEINKLRTVAQKYKHVFGAKADSFEDYIDDVIRNLNYWRQTYNSNKHEYENLDSNHFIKERKMIVIDKDVLSYIHVAICIILVPMLISIAGIIDKTDILEH